MDLNSSVGELPLVGPVYQKKLEKLGIISIKDLIYHLPSKYLDYQNRPPIEKMKVGETVTVQGNLRSLKNQYTKTGRKMQIGEVENKTGKLTVLWFNQPFLVRTLYPGTEVSLSGKIEWFGHKIALLSPEYEVVKKEGDLTHTGKIIPVYPETEGVSSKWLRTKIKNAFRFLGNEIKEPRSESFGFVDLPTAVKFVHFPENFTETKLGKQKLAFEELLFLHLQSLKRRDQWQKNTVAHRLKINNQKINNFVKNLPFELTASQNKTVKEILEDLGKKHPMNRLLEGDVGSGKTVVAAIAAFAALSEGYQTVIMAPTQILARQHFNTLNSLLQSFKVPISLITSDTRLHLPDAKATGGQVFIGTHALIHQKINFNRVALVVIDEQHRFGVEQQSHLIKKTKNRMTAPHILTMTATPIPRSVALTLYGDLDLSVLTEIPLGRQKITTWVVPADKRNKAYTWIGSQITDHQSQIFFVCPLIEESNVETMKDVKAVTSEYVSLKKIFKNQKVGLLHGRQKETEKNKILNKFRKSELDILVTTPVIEVGVDIPAATIMVIDGAERFGLAQLHQLRGRVGRGEKKSYCLLFSNSNESKVAARLAAMEKSLSGFELAELDLRLRGPGEIFGLRQHGLPDLKIASWTDTALIKKAKEAALRIYHL